MGVKKSLSKTMKLLIGVLLLIYTLFPIYWLVAMSIRPMNEMRGHISLIPKSLTWEHFVHLFTEKGFGRALINSLQVTGVSLVVSMTFGLCAA